MSQTIASLKAIYEIDLKRLKDEMLLYKDESDLWKKVDGVSNSGGHLALHICGNLQHFFGAVIAHNGYVRDREFEFKAQGVSLDHLLTEIENAKKTVDATLELLDDNQLSDNFPIEVFGFPMTNNHFLIRLIGHLNYHLGQINYHRRLV